jgi:hypothetical protein
MSANSPIKFCSGFGQLDTPRLSNNPESFLRLTYPDIKEMVDDPQDRPKEKAQWCIPSTRPSRVYEDQRKHGDRHLLTFDKDQNPEIDFDDFFNRARGVIHGEMVAYTSKGASEDNQKARLIIPLAEPVSGRMGVILQTILNNRMEAAGVIPDRAMEGAAQLCYLPNKGEFYRSLVDDFVAPFNPKIEWSEDIAKIQEQIEAEKEAAKARHEAGILKTAQRVASGTHDVMDAYKQSMPIDVALEHYGYKRCGKKYLSPNSESGNPGVSISDDGCKWVSHHSSDSGIGENGKGNSRWGDSWDLYKYFECGNDQTAALKIAGDTLLTPDGVSLNKDAQRKYMEQKSQITADDFETISNPSGVWEDPEPLEREVPPAPEFPMDVLPEDVRAYVLDHVERLQCPPDMVAMAAIVELAGLIGKEATIRPKDLDSEWSERACIWNVLISPKSTMKSSALKAGLKNLNRIQVRDSEVDRKEKKKYLDEKHRYELRVKAFENQCKSILKKDSAAELPEMPESIIEPEPPQSRRRIIKDSTLEKTADLMIQSPGLTMSCDELAGFMLNMNRYSAGSDRQFYLECYSGGNHPIDRVSRGEQFISDMYMNIIGGVQPAVARQLFCSDDSDDGFFERFIPIYPERKTDWKLVDRYPDHEARELMNNLCDRLAGKNWRKILSMDNDSNGDEYGKPYACFDAKAQAAFNKWLTVHMNGLATMSEDDLTLGFAGKRRGLLVRLCLIFHLAKWAGGEQANIKLVSDETLQDALTLLSGYIIPMQERTVAAFAMSDFDNDVKRIVGWIKKDKIKKFRSRELLRKQWSGLKTNKDILPKLEYLVELNWLRVEAKTPGAKGGRSSSVFLVNPSVVGK